MIQCLKCNHLPSNKHKKILQTAYKLNTTQKKSLYHIDKMYTNLLEKTSSPMCCAPCLLLSNVFTIRRHFELDSRTHLLVCIFHCFKIESIRGRAGATNDHNSGAIQSHRPRGPEELYATFAMLFRRTAQSCPLRDRVHFLDTCPRRAGRPAVLGEAYKTLTLNP